MRTAVSTAVLTGPAQAVQRAMLAADDLCGAGRIEELTTAAGGDVLEVKVTFAEGPPI